MSKKKIVIGSIVTLVLFVAGASIFAQTEQRRSTREKMYRSGQQTGHQMMTQMQGQRNLCKAEDLIGSDVKSEMSSGMGQSQTSTDMSTQTPTGTSERTTTGTSSQTPSGTSEQTTTGTYGEKQSTTNPHRGMTTRSSSGENIGKVEDLIIDQSQDKVEYVVLKSEGKYYPVPWSTFEVQEKMSRSEMRHMGTTEANDSNATSQSTAKEKPVLILNITKDQLKQAPTIDKISDQSVSDPSLKQKTESFWSQYMPMRSKMMQGISSRMQSRSQMQSQTGGTTGTRGMEANEPNAAGQMASNLRKATDLIGKKVEGTSNAEVGKIKDLVIDTRQGQVAYCLINFGGFMGIGEKIAAVPFSSVTMQQNVARINATQEQLNALAIGNEDPITKLSQPEFARQVHENMGVQPYWEVYGFAPGEARGALMGAMAGWAASSSYNQNFKPDKVTTIQGTIENVSTFQPETGSANGTELTVKTSDGQTMTVQTGPELYIKQQGFEFKPGSKVEVTGSKVEINNKEVIMASQINSEGKTLMLRDSQGKPQWGQQMRERMQQRQQQRQQMNQPSQQPGQRQSQQKSTNID